MRLCGFLGLVLGVASGALGRPSSSCINIADGSGLDTALIVSVCKTDAPRAVCADTFNTSTSVYVLMLSTTAGGVGINLTAANKCARTDRLTIARCACGHSVAGFRPMCFALLQLFCFTLHLTLMTDASAHGDLYLSILRASCELR